MISGTNKFEIDRNSSFLPMEICANEETRVSSDPEPRVSKNRDRFDTPSPDSASGSRNPESDELLLSIHGFRTGDMVWGKVKSHPWWPGHIFNESFASPSVLRTKHEGHVLVAFFGDSSYGWFDPAELIHYAPNFIEKSKQTTARSFLKAVDESVDESSRRAALGLSCMCRPYNFSPTHVPGYFMVDMPGFEGGGLYSAAQIERSLEEFDPAEALVFLQGIALEPTNVEQREIGKVTIFAQLLEIRRALFEEFDETYAQAFGTQLTQMAQDKLEDEPEKFASRVAPLSGPLVIAENLGDKKKKKKKSYFTKPSSLSPSSKKKKSKYLLKRRDEVPTASTYLPDAYFGRQEKQPKIKAPSGEPEVLDYAPLDDRNPSATEFPSPILVDQKMAADTKEKLKKRSPVDRDDKGEVITKKKKKKLELLGQDAALPSKKADAQPDSDRTSEPDLEPLGPLGLPELLADLSALAMDPFYGFDRNTPSIVRHVFLKLRSIVYQKSADSESDSPKEAKRTSEVTPRVKPGSLFKRSHDRKRAPSDRQEEISANRVKRLNQLKSLSTEKKAAVTQTAPQRVKDSNAAPSSASDAARKPEKQEPILPLPPKKFCPTNLIMKFPPRSTLPSVANLKARFARFGPIVVDRCRVLWSSHTCKVQFKYRVDALEAYKYVRDNNLFGQIQVVYSVGEVEHPGSESQFRPGNGSGAGGSMAQPRTWYRQGQLKSILKKPGDEPGKESQRVKFRLAEDSRSEPPQLKHRTSMHPPPRSQRVPPPLRGPSLSQHTEAHPRGSGSEGGNVNADGKVDIYHRMLSLMMRCNDIVTGLQSVPGFVPYRPL